MDAAAARPVRFGLFGLSLPGLVALCLVLAAALPWGVPADVSFLLPFVTFSAAFYWVMYQPRCMPVWLAFVLGLLTDVLTNGPFGFWALMFVVGHTLSVLARPRNLELFWLKTLSVFAFVVVCVGVLGWGVASLYFFQLIDWQPVAFSAVGAVLAYPVLSFVLSGIDALISAPAPRVRHLEGS